MTMMFTLFRFAPVVCIAGGVIFLLCSLQGGTGAARAQQNSSAAEESGLKDEPIEPIPRTIVLDAQKVALGEMLFNDPRLSHDEIACLRVLGKAGIVVVVGVIGGKNASIH